MPIINVIILLSVIETGIGLEQLYKHLETDDNFNVKIVCFERTSVMKKAISHTIKYSSILLERQIEFIDYKGGDLEYLNPDYVFYQSPYADQNHPDLNIQLVQKYSKICFFGYGYEVWHCNQFKQLSMSFLRKANFFFMENEIYTNEFMEYVKQNGEDVEHFKQITFTTGHPKVNAVKFQKNINYTLFGWNPRWMKHQSTLNIYGDLISNHFKENDNINLQCRFHPLQSIQTRNEFEDKIENIKNITIHTELYYDKYFENIDVLITDLGSFIGEFFPTGKPIILTNHKNNNPSNFVKEISKGIYIVNNEDELKETIINLQNKKDPLKEIRLELIEQYYNCYKPTKNIANVLLWDYKLNYIQKVKKIEEPKKEE